MVIRSIFPDYGYKIEFIMKLDEIEKHWVDWAKRFGEDIRATEKSRTRKALETDALVRLIKNAGFSEKDEFQILEPGCGTGHNCLSVAKFFPNAKVFGFDYIADMVLNAQKLCEKLGVENIKYFKGNLIDLRRDSLPRDSFDIVFTNRCIINLNSHEIQAAVVKNLSELVAKGGSLILGENPEHKFQLQNELRGYLELDDRTPPDFNLLIDEDNIISALKEASFKIDEIDDFSALHDILLYVIIPKINGGFIDYNHPMLEVVKTLSPMTYKKYVNGFGHFGQNRMYRFSRA